jgi:hypothetical protein
MTTGGKAAIKVPGPVPPYISSRRDDHRIVTNKLAEIVTIISQKIMGRFRPSTI